jgi:hypothetical protein
LILKGLKFLRVGNPFKTNQGWQIWPFQVEVSLLNRFFHVYEQREDKIVRTWRAFQLRKQDAGNINQDSVVEIVDAIELKNSLGTDDQNATLDFNLSEGNPMDN